MAIKLIADSGSTKAEWCLLDGKKKKTIFTQGISPYFLTLTEIVAILEKELKPKMKGVTPSTIHFYGTGCSNPANVKMMKGALKKIFPKATITVDHDLMGAAKALCGDQKGIAEFEFPLMSAGKQILLCLFERRFLVTRGASA